MLGNILHLGVKELRSLARDPVMLFLIAWGFTGAIDGRGHARRFGYGRPWCTRCRDRSGCRRALQIGWNDQCCHLARRCGCSRNRLRKIRRDRMGVAARPHPA